MEVAVLRSPSLTVPTVSVDVNNSEEEEDFRVHDDLSFSLFVVK